MANKWIGSVTRREETVDSTNRVARQWAREGAPHGALVVAGAQSGGRGRRGRDWDSPAGMGLWLSIVLREVLPEQKPLVPLGTALAVADACRQAALVTPDIKWPNDLVLGNKKMAGILAEAEGEAVVVGIGVNVRQRPEDFPPDLRETATSLETATGCQVDMDALEAAVLDHMEARMSAFDFLDEYKSRCVTLNTRVRVHGVEQLVEGLAEALDAGGVLLVRDDRGIVHRVLAGDVSVRGARGYT